MNLAALEATQLAQALADSLVTHDTPAHSEVKEDDPNNTNDASSTKTESLKNIQDLPNNTDSDHDSNDSNDSNDSDNSNDSYTYDLSSDDEATLPDKIQEEINECSKFNFTAYCVPIDNNYKAKFKDHHLIYLSFLPSDIFGAKLNLSGAWGFDTKQPIMLRLRGHRYYWSEEDLASWR